MTEGAVVRDFLLAMAIHAGAHRQVFRLGHYTECFHFSMAICAFCFSIHMGLVTPIDEGWNLVYTHPGHALLFGAEFRQLLDIF